MEAAFFDLDKTIVSRSSSLARRRGRCTAPGMVSRGQLLRGAYAQLVYLLVGADEHEDGAPEGGHAPAHEGAGIESQLERLVEERDLGRDRSATCIRKPWI